MSFNSDYFNRVPYEGPPEKPPKFGGTAGGSATGWWLAIIVLVAAVVWMGAGRYYSSANSSADNKADERMAATAVNEETEEVAEASSTGEETSSSSSENPSGAAERLEVSLRREPNNGVLEVGETATCTVCVDEGDTRGLAYTWKTNLAYATVGGSRIVLSPTADNVGQNYVWVEAINIVGETDTAEVEIVVKPPFDGFHLSESKIVILPFVNPRETVIATFRDAPSGAYHISWYDESGRSFYDGESFTFTVDDFGEYKGEIKVEASCKGYSQTVTLRINLDRVDLW